MFTFLRQINYRSPSVISLIGFNLALVVIGIILNWSAYDMVMAFWVENLVVGIFFIAKLNSAIASAENIIGSIILGIFITAFFSVHYSGFCLGHGTFIIALLGDGHMEGGLIMGIVNAIDPFIFWISFIVLFISHGISFKTNFLDKKEGEDKGMKDMMIAPYRRIVLVQVFVIGCGFAIAFLGKQNAFFLIAFVAMKIIVDLRQHYMEHNKAKSKT